MLFGCSYYFSLFLWLLANTAKQLHKVRVKEETFQVLPKDADRINWNRKQVTYVVTPQNNPPNRRNAQDLSKVSAL